jgi:phosphomannomutase
MTKSINPAIFKAYDIRGIYPEELHEETAYKVGRAYAALLKEENPDKTLEIVVSNDMRLSGPQLKEQLIKGLTDSGINVIDIGLASTPTFYFAVGFYDFDGGINVSASHNPKQYNGFKMVRAKGKPISGDTGIMEIRDMAVAGEFAEVEKQGTVTKKEGVLEDLVKEQMKDVDTAAIKPLKIVVDAANAMGSMDVDAMFANLDCELIRLNWELDGTFPNHEADPLKDENLMPVQEAIKEHQADLGISIDGDADRYFFVDDQGEPLRQEILRGIMAQIALKENPGSTVCYDIRPGKITKDMIEEAGGKAVVTKVGHSLIKETMLKEDAVFGGESSGHYFYRFDYGTFEAPVVLVMKFLRYLSKQDKPLSAVIKPYQKYYHSGEINSVVDDAKAKMKKLAKKYSDAKISHLDGITVTYNDFWFNVRASNTEPKLRLNLEAISPEIMKQKRDEVLSVIRA